MKAETITGAMGTLENAGIPEEQRMATIQAIAEMQQPLFDAIGKLESKMDARFEKLESKIDTKFDRMDSRVRRLEWYAAGSLIPLVFISYRLLSSIPG